MDDVASASISLMNHKNNCGKIFNITVSTPVLFEEAFNTYLQSVDHFKNINIKTKTIALLSNAINNYPSITKHITESKLKKYFFTIWMPGFEILYSSKKLLSTSYKFRYENFEDVLQSCLDKLWINICG